MLANLHYQKGEGMFIKNGNSSILIHFNVNSGKKTYKFFYWNIAILVSFRFVILNKKDVQLFKKCHLVQFRYGHRPI